MSHFSSVAAVWDTDDFVLQLTEAVLARGFLLQRALSKRVWRWITT